MKKRTLFLKIGILMGIVAICFVIFALSNPQSSFPWSNMITYGIYIVYIMATILFIFKGFKGN